MTQLERLVGLLSDGRLWRMGELAGAGVAGATVQRAVVAGLIERVARGAYRCLDAPYCEHAHLAAALVRLPRGLVCLHSAAEVHGLGDESPRRVWVAIPHGSRAARIEWPPVRFVRWRDPVAFLAGVERRNIDGVEVRLTNPARTVLDMLRMSSTVGEDRALDCLRDYYLSGRSVSELLAMAKALGWHSRLAGMLRATSAVAVAA